MRRLENFNQYDSSNAEDYHNAVKLSVADIYYSFLIHDIADGEAPSDTPKWFRDYFNKVKTPQVFTLPLGEIIALSGKTREHISRMFKRFTGVNISDYVMSNKINYACSLLRDNDLSVNEVAKKSGFENMGTFYSNFKRRMGESPHRYRRAGMVGVQTFKNKRKE